MPVVGKIEAEASAEQPCSPCSAELPRIRSGPRGLQFCYRRRTDPKPNKIRSFNIYVGLFPYSCKSSLILYSV